MKCSQDILYKFSLEHFTFINQIFGDATVRQTITNLFKNNKYAFDVENVENVETENLFEHGFHHILVAKTSKSKKNTGKIPETLYCSVDFGHQDLLTNKNDTLCQSYTLLQYLEHPVDDIFNNKTLSNKQKMMLTQREMIQMYSNLIRDKRFIREFRTIDFFNTADTDGYKMFRNYSKNNKDGEPVALNLHSDAILGKIEKVLKKWNDYGYIYFIGTGKCKKNEQIDSLDEVLE